MIDTPYVESQVVAEIGCNHKGNLDIALELITLAAKAGATYAKFQKRHPRELLDADAYLRPHPVPYNAYGETYGAHREFLELDLEQHRQLQQHCFSEGIGYATSVWDLTSAKEIITLEPDFIKIPSACNSNLDLLSYLMQNYTGDLHISLGMTNQAEEKALMTLLTPAANRVILYACTSGYPVAFEDACLLEITRLRESYGAQVKAIGYSGHHLGIAIDIAAYTLGAQWLERHFTKDRTWKGTDHAASLEPGGLGKLVRNLNATHKSLSYKSTEILDIEAPHRAKLKHKS